MVYAYTPDGLVASIAETDNTTVPGESLSATIVFAYDNRNRLISETRTDSAAGLPPVNYDLSYTYDQGGNRLSKTDNLTGVVTTYTYDISEIDDGDQNNNRLLRTETRDAAMALIERTWYLYGPAGNVGRLVKESGGAPTKDVFWFYYNASGQLWLTVLGQGDYNEATQDVTSAVYFDAAEYRYDSGRQRYLVRARDPNNSFAILGTGQWRDYLGESVYNDYTVDATSGNVMLGTAYAPGIGFDDPALDDMPAYVGSDLIGTTRRVTDSAAGGPQVLERSVCTAFGERLSLTDGSGNPNASPVSRYGYAGAWGYEEATCEPPGAPTGWCDPLSSLGWLHVGARYYDPAVGRFMQRDPIGIRGGLNTYEYIRSNPSLNIDPDGFQTINVGDPLPNNPRPYPRPQSGRIKIKLRLRPSTPPIPWWKPAFPITTAVCVKAAFAAGIGYAVGTGINYGVKKITGKSFSDRIGEKIWEWTGTKGPPGYRPY